MPLQYAPQPVGNGDRPHRRGNPRSYHVLRADIDHKHDADGENIHRQPHEKGLEPQAQQTADVHIRKPVFQVGDNGCNVDAGIADDNPGALIDNALRQVEHAHDDVPGVGYQQDSGGGLEHPAEIYLVTSLGPIPLATIGNSEWRGMGHNAGNVDAGIADNHPGALIDNALGDVEHGHDDVPGIRYEDDSGGGFEHPAKQLPEIPVCPGLSSVPYHGGNRHLRRVGAKHRPLRRRFRGDMGLYGLYGAAVLLPIQNPVSNSPGRKTRLGFFCSVSAIQRPQSYKKSPTTE